MHPAVEAMIAEADEIASGNGEYFTLVERSKMGTYYSIYAEVKVGDRWYNLNPLFQREDGKLDVMPVISGRSSLRDAYDELEESRYQYGRPDTMSQEVRTVFYHNNDEVCELDLQIPTYKDFYNRHMFLVNYGKSVKSRVIEGRPTRYQGYAHKHSIAAYEIGETEEMGLWLTEEEYQKLPKKEQAEYSFYQWDGWDDWYAMYNRIVNRVDCMLSYFCCWADYAIKDADLDERCPTADYVRLIVYRI